MGLIAAIVALLGGISAVLGVVNILQITSQPIFSDKLTWTFWMAMAVVLLLLAIVLLLGRKPGGSAD